MTKTKAKGTRVEQKVIDMFEAIGGKCVRSAGSHGPFDVIVFLKPAVFLIQVKANRKPDAAEIERMRNFPTNSLTAKAYCFWKDYDKSPDFWWEHEWGGD